MGPSLLVLGGDASALPALRWAGEAGLATVLVDSDPHAPARRAAREFHTIPARDAEAHAALARRLAQQRELAGILAAEPARFALLPLLADAAPGRLPPRRTLERVLHAEAALEFLRGRGFPVGRAAAEGACLDLFAFFRDGAFVPGGIAARRTLARGDVASVQPSGLDPACEHAAYVLAERAARALGLEHGPLQVELCRASGTEDEAGLVLVALHPGFADLMGVSHVASLAYGKSPLQAWFAHLSGAGGPFDELVLAPRATAGWLSLAPERAGFFAGVDGTTRVRALPGVVDLWIDEPGRELGPGASAQRPLGYLWAEARDPAELAERMLAARAALEVRVASARRVACAPTP